MLIVCPNCAMSYQVDPSSLGAAGRSVRCARCKKTWFAANPQALAAIADSHHEDMATFAATAATSSADRSAPERPPAAPPTRADDGFPVLDAAPPIAPAQPPEPPAPPEVALDDRGPAPLPEPVVERPAPPAAEEARAPAARDQPAPEAPAETAPTDIESAALRIQRKAARRRSAAVTRRWVTAILALIAINAGLLAWRAEIVRLLPQTASLYAAIGLPVNLRGLDFGEIVTRKEQQDGVPMLVIEGTIKSTSKRNAEVPRLRFAVRNARGQEIYSWTALPAGKVLAPGEVLPFRTRLASPPPEAHAVLVRFFNRRDLIAGSQ